MNVLRIQHPSAKKEHICMFCGCKIKVGERYERQTITDGEIYDWVCHQDCSDIATKLDMYDGLCSDEGLAGDSFECAIDDYLIEHYSDSPMHIRDDIRKMTRIEQVRMISSDIRQLKVK